MKGYCCSQMLLQLGIEQKEGENQGVINAVSALCNGFFSGRICGALSGGACLLTYLAPKQALENRLINELFDWFECEYSTIECRDLLAADPMAKVELCPVIVENTYKKVMELLFNIGCEPSV